MGAPQSIEQCVVSIAGLVMMLAATMAGIVRSWVMRRAASEPQLPNALQIFNLMDLLHAYVLSSKNLLNIITFTYRNWS